jgi:hypothetical protein
MGCNREGMTAATMPAFEVFVHYKTGEVSTRLIAVGNDEQAAAEIIRHFGMADEGDRLKIRLLRNSKYATHPEGSLLIGPDSIRL